MRIVFLLPLLLASTLASAQPAVLAVAPVRLAFIAAAGARGAASQRVTVRATGGAPAWRAVPSAPWLRVAPATGKTPGEFSVTIDAVRLSPGSHAGRVTVSDVEDAAVVPVTVEVSVQIAAAPGTTGAPPPAQAPPQVITRPRTAPAASGPSGPKLDLVAASGSASPVESPVTLESPSPGPTEWFARPDQPWITVNPVTGLTPTRVIVRAHPAGLGNGTHRAVLRFVDDAGDAMLIVPVTLSIGDVADDEAIETVLTKAAPAAAAPTPAVPARAGAVAEDASARVEALSITADTLPSVIRGLPYSQTIPVKGGKPPYSFRLMNGRLPQGLALANGALAGTTRIPGTYTLLMSVSDSSTPPQAATKTLSLRVIIAYQNTVLTVAPKSLSLYATAGQPVRSARIGVESGAQRMAWTAVADQPWLRLAPAEGLAPTVVEVGVDATKLAQGTHVGTITVTMDGAPNSPFRIPVQLLVQR